MGNRKHFNQLFAFFLLVISTATLFGQSNIQNPFFAGVDLADSLLSENEDSLAKIYIDELAVFLNKESDIEVLLYQKLLGDYYLGTSKYKESVEAYEPLLLLLNNEYNKDLSLKLARAINDLGIAYMKVGQFEDAINSHKESQEIYDAFNEPQGGSYNYNNLAVIYKELKKIDSAVYFHNKSLEYAILANDSIGIGFNQLNIGMLMIDNKEPIEAMDYFQKALNVFEDLENEGLILATKRRVGRAYSMMKDFESAIQIQKEALEYYSEKGSKNGLARVHLDIGELQLKLDQYDSAKFHIDKCIELYKEQNYLKGLVNGYNVLGQYYRAIEDFEKARENYNKSFQLSVGKFIGMEANNLKGLAEISLRQGDYQKAIALGKESLTKIDNSASLSNLVATYNLLYRAYKSVGNDNEALKYLELLNEQRKLIFGEDQALEIARIEYRNRLERERAIEEEQQRLKELAYEQELTRERWIRFGALTVLVLVALIALSLYRGNRIKKLANAQLSEKNERLKELRENEKRLSDETIASKERELATMAMASHEKNSVLNDLNQKISFLENRMDDELKPSLKDMRKTIENSYSLDNSWDSFLHKFENVHPQFFDRLKEENPNLTAEDMKLSAYLKIGMSNKEIANVTHLTLGSVKSKINRLKKKLEMGPEDSLRDFILKYA